MISIRIYTPIFSFYFPFTLDWCLEKKTKTHSPNLAWNPPGGPGGGPPAGTPPGGPWKGLGSCGGGCLSRAHRRRRGGGHGLSRLGLWFFHRHFLTTFSHYKEFSKSFEGMNALFFLEVGTYTPPKNCRITTDQRTRRSLVFFWGVPCNLSFSSSCQNFSSCGSIRDLIPKPLVLGYLLGGTW